MSSFDVILLHTNWYITLHESFLIILPYTHILHANKHGLIELPLGCYPGPDMCRTSFNDVWTSLQKLWIYNGWSMGGSLLFLKSWHLHIPLKLQIFCLVLMPLYWACGLTLTWSYLTVLIRKYGLFFCREDKALTNVP